MYAIIYDDQNNPISLHGMTAGGFNWALIAAFIAALLQVLYPQPPRPTAGRQASPQEQAEEALYQHLLAMHLSALIMAGLPSAQTGP